MADFDTELPNDTDEEPEGYLLIDGHVVAIAQTIGIVDGSSIAENFKLEIQKALEELNTIKLSFQVKHITNLLKATTDKVKLHSLSAGEIWQIICDYNLSKSIAESYTETDEMRYIKSLQNTIEEEG